MNRDWTPPERAENSLPVYASRHERERCAYRNGRNCPKPDASGITDYKSVRISCDECPRNPNAISYASS